MSRRIAMNTFSPALLGLLLIGCGSGGGPTPSGGIGGTGVVSSGTITAFGSVWQNGIEYQTTGAEFEVNDLVVITNAAAGDDQTHFHRGMRVTVTGTSSGATATATRIEYDSDLKGPVSAIDDTVDNNGRFKDLTVYGTTVRLDRDNTLFDDAPPAVTFDTIAVGDIVEISALVDAGGRLNATYVRLTDDLGTTPDPEVELKGAVSALDTVANQFAIGTVTIAYDDATTDFVNVPGDSDTGLANDQYVEVKGTHTGATAIDASRIEIEEGLFGDNESQVEIEGIVTLFVDPSNFRITIDGNPANTLPVDASGATTVTPPNLFSDGLVGVGTKLEIEGQITGGTLIAQKVEPRGNQVKAEATVEFTGSNSITLRITPFDTLTVNVDAQTQFRDDFGVSPFGLTDVNSGDFLEVRGGWDGSNVTLSEVRRRDRDVSPADGDLDDGGDDVILQGPLDAPATASGLSILGVGFDFDGGTSFEDFDESPFSDATAFVDSPNNQAGVIVKVEDGQIGASGLGDSVADEVEFEN